MGVHVYAPQPTERAIHAGRCLDCGKRTRFAGVFTPWYGWKSTCLRCGRTWCDSEWIPLPFERGARAKSIEAAKKRYRRAAAVARERSEHSSPPSSEEDGPWDDQNPTSRGAEKVSVQLDDSWFLMCRRDLTDLRVKAMMALAKNPEIPAAVLDYVSAVEQAFLNHEANHRSESCRDMWDQWRKDRP